MVQEVIIYRGPVEYAIYNSPYIFPIFCACAVGLVAFLASYNGYKKLQHKVFSNWRYGAAPWKTRCFNHDATWVAAAVGFACAYFVFNAMVI